MGQPLVSLVVLTYNEKGTVLDCLNSLKITDYKNLEIILVDNGSDDTETAVKKLYPNILYLKQKSNLGFSRGINVGLRRAKGAYVVPVNNDITVLSRDWLKTFVAVAESDPKIGIVACELIYPDGRKQPTGGTIRIGPLTGSCVKKKKDYSGLLDVQISHAGLVLIRRAVLDKIGLFDEGYSPFFSEEIDYCVRTRKAGFRVVYCSKVRAAHDKNLTVNKMESNSTYYAVRKNAMRFKLLNYPLSWLVISLFYEPRMFLGVFFENTIPDGPFRFSNIRRRPALLLRLGAYLRAYWTNFVHLPEILNKRFDRTARLW